MKVRINEHSTRNRWACQVSGCGKVIAAFDASVVTNGVVDHLAEAHGDLVREPMDPGHCDKEDAS